MDTLSALALLEKCRGDEIWSPEHCRQQNVPEPWIERLGDCFESGFDSDLNTIYVGDRKANQYHGVRDVDIAYEIAQSLDLNTESIRQSVFDRNRQVARIKEVVEEELL